MTADTPETTGAAQIPPAVDEETYSRMRGLVVAEFLAVVCLGLEALAIAWLIS
jgi:hypothetical protein